MAFRMLSSSHHVDGACRSTLWFLTSSAAACEHLAHWPRMRITQNLKPARVKKYPTSCNRCKTSPTCSSFSLTSVLSWIIFISHPEHTVAGGREQLCRLMTCSDGRISVVSVCSWRFIFRLGGGGARLKSLVYSGAYWFGSDWLRLRWSSTWVTECHLQRANTWWPLANQNCAGSRQPQGSKKRSPLTVQLNHRAGTDL